MSGLLFAQRIANNKKVLMPQIKIGFRDHCMQSPHGYIFSYNHHNSSKPFAGHFFLFLFTNSDGDVFLKKEKNAGISESNRCQFFFFYQKTITCVANSPRFILLECVIITTTRLRRMIIFIWFFFYQCYFQLLTHILRRYVLVMYRMASFS